MRDLIFSLLFFAITFANLEGGDTSRMLLDLDVIKSVFETKYAPYEWKKNYLGWNLEDEIQLAKIKILSLNSLTVKDYQRILHSFFVSIRDHHVHDHYYSTAKSLLPFEIKSANHRYFFTDLDQKSLDEMVSKETYKGEKLPQIGDELILFDSRPVDDVIQEIKFQELADLTSRTSQMFAEKILTKRIGAMGHLVPEGPILIQFKTPDESLIEATIEWVHTPEKIHHHSYTSAMATFGKPEKAIENKEQPSLLPSDQMMNILADVLNKDYSVLLNTQFGIDEESSEKDGASSNEEESEPSSEGSDSSSEESDDSEEQEEDDDDEPPTIPVPPRAVKRSQIIFGRKLWEEPKPSPFHAYIYQLPGTNKKIGYIRISTYSVNRNKNSVNKDKNEEDVMQHLLHLAHSLHVLQAKTDALLIDQVDNPGGSLHYMFAILSMLTDQPLTTIKNRVAITQNEVAQAFKKIRIVEEAIKELEKAEKDMPETSEAIAYHALSFLDGQFIDLHFLKDYFSYYQFVINEWNEGKTLTSPFPISGMATIQPHPFSNYTKPILFLVNCNSFSCGDIAPAILQDNQRALIFGEQTAGAGGAVETHTYPNSFGLEKFSYTVSLIERLSGVMVENIGVTPDVPYDLTQNDILNGYPDYIEAVNQTLEQMVN